MRVKINSTGEIKEVKQVGDKLFDKENNWYSLSNVILLDNWRPASELPPVDKETGLSDEVIAIQDRFFEGERVIWTRIVGRGWKHDNIKWWCYPPKEE